MGGYICTNKENEMPHTDLQIDHDCRLQIICKKKICKSLNFYQLHYFLLLESIFEIDAIIFEICQFIPNYGFGSGSKSILNSDTVKITCFLVSQNAHVLMLGKENGMFEIWNVSNGTCIHVLQAHDQHISCCAITSNNHNFILTGSHDKQLKLWSLQKGKCKRTFSGHKHNIAACCFSVDNKLIFSAARDKTIKVWNFKGSCLRTLFGNLRWLRDFCIISNMNLVISDGDEKIVHIKKIQDVHDTQYMRGHKRSIRCCAMTSDDAFLITGSFDKTLRIWSVQDGFKCDNFF